MPNASTLVPAPRPPHRSANGISTPSTKDIEMNSATRDQIPEHDEIEDELWPWVPLPGGGLELRFEADGKE